MRGISIAIFEFRFEWRGDQWPEIIAPLQEPGIIAGCGRNAVQVIPLTRVVLRGGLLALDVTMTTPNALARFARATRKFGNRAVIVWERWLDGPPAGGDGSDGSCRQPNHASRNRGGGVQARPSVMLCRVHADEAPTGYEAGGRISSNFFRRTGWGRVTYGVGRACRFAHCATAVLI